MSGNVQLASEGQLDELRICVEKAFNNLRGRLDADTVQNLIGNSGILDQLIEKLVPRVEIKSRSILRPIQLGLAIPATDGARFLAETKETFPGYIDPDFTKYGCNVHGEARPKTLVDVHELTENAIFRQMFEGQGAPLDKLCLTQDQIEKFVLVHRRHLHPQGYSTFFLFKVEEDFFVAGVRWHDDRGLRVDVHRFSCDSVWSADSRRRVVLPQLALKPS